MNFSSYNSNLQQQQQQPSNQLQHFHHLHHQIPSPPQQLHLQQPQQQQFYYIPHLNTPSSPPTSNLNNNNQVSSPTTPPTSSNTNTTNTLKYLGTNQFDYNISPELHNQRNSSDLIDKKNLKGGGDTSTMLPASSSSSAQQQSTSPQQHISSDLTHLPLPSIFQQQSSGMNPPPILFSPSASLTTAPQFLLPPTAISHGNMFAQDSSQGYMMNDVVDQFQMHSGPTHHSYPQSVASYPYLYLQQHSAHLQQQHHQQQHQQQQQQQQHQQQQQQQQQQHQQMQNIMPSLTATTHTPPAKTVKRKHTTEKLRTDASGSPLVIPKCTRCQESASWRHDKRRWWCKECKKAFTPGITKSPSQPPPQQVQQHQPQQQQQQPQPILQTYQHLNMSPWDHTLPNSSQNTPPSMPQNPHSITPISTACPSCSSPGSWKHDKKSAHCKQCKKPFPIGIDGIATSPTSPGKSNKKSTKTAKKSASSSATSSPQPQLPLISNMAFQPSYFLPPLAKQEMRTSSPTPNTPPSIPSPLMTNLSTHNIMPNALIPSVNSLSPNGANTPKKLSKKKDKDSIPGDVQVLVSVGVDNSLMNSSHDLSRGVNEEWKMATSNTKFSNIQT